MGIASSNCIKLKKNKVNWDHSLDFHYGQAFCPYYVWISPLIKYKYKYKCASHACNSAYRKRRPRELNLKVTLDTQRLWSLLVPFESLFQRTNKPENNNKSPISNIRIKYIMSCGTDIVDIARPVTVFLVFHIIKDRLIFYMSGNWKDLIYFVQNYKIMFKSYFLFIKRKFTIKFLSQDSWGLCWPRTYCVAKACLETVVFLFQVFQGLEWQTWHVTQACLFFFFLFKNRLLPANKHL